MTVPWCVLCGTVHEFGTPCPDVDEHYRCPDCGAYIGPDRQGTLTKVGAHRRWVHRIPTALADCSRATVPPESQPHGREGSS